MQYDNQLLQMQQKMALTISLIIYKRNSWAFPATSQGARRGLLDGRGLLRLAGGWFTILDDFFKRNGPVTLPPSHTFIIPMNWWGQQDIGGGGFESEVKNRRTSKGASENFIKRFAYMDVHFQKFARALRAG